MGRFPQSHTAQRRSRPGPHRTYPSEDPRRSPRAPRPWAPTRQADSRPHSLGPAPHRSARGLARDRRPGRSCRASRPWDAPPHPHGRTALTARPPQHPSQWRHQTQPTGLATMGRLPQSRRPPPLTRPQPHRAARGLAQDRRPGRCCRASRPWDASPTATRPNGAHRPAPTEPIAVEPPNAAHGPRDHGPPPAKPTPAPTHSPPAPRRSARGLARPRRRNAAVALAAPDFPRTPPGPPILVAATSAPGPDRHERLDRRTAPAPPTTADVGRSRTRRPRDSDREAPAPLRDRAGSRLRADGPSPHSAREEVRNEPIGAALRRPCDAPAQPTHPQALYKASKRNEPGSHDPGCR